MKKSFIFLLCILILGCSFSFQNKQDHRPQIRVSNSCIKTEIISLDGHDYVIAHTNHCSGGISIIHSESCPCKNRY